MATRAPGGPETILLVEDDAMVRRLTHHILQHLGYAVLVAQSAEEALQVHHDCAHAIQLVLTDVILPRMSGPDLVERQLRLRRTSGSCICPGTRTRPFQTTLHST